MSDRLAGRENMRCPLSSQDRRLPPDALTPRQRTPSEFRNPRADGTQVHILGARGKDLQVTQISRSTGEEMADTGKDKVRAV